MACTSLCVAPAIAGPEPFEKTDLVSDQINLAPHRDSDLLNPWGIVVTRDGVFRLTTHGTGKIVSYDDTGRDGPADVRIHGGGADIGATGLVLNEHRSAFRFTNSNRRGDAMLIVVGTDGSISAFNPSLDINDAVRVVQRDNAAYLGAAIAERNGRPYLYVANFAQGRVEVYDRQWNRVTRNGAFQDSRIPDDFAPFNIIAWGNKLYVAYAKRDGDEEATGAGLGYVNEFDTRGNLTDRLIARGRLDAPWGLAVAPSSLGDFSHALLVGNFGDGRINAYNRQSGRFIGQVEDMNGQPLEIEGLWGLTFGRGSSAERRTLYFTAGPGDENHGLFGELEFKGRSRASDDDDDDLLAQRNLKPEIGPMDEDPNPDADTVDGRMPASDQEFVIVDRATGAAVVDESANDVVEGSASSLLRVETVGGNIVRVGNGSTLRFSITGTETSAVRVDIFNVAGELVAQPVRDEVLTGRGEVQWDGRDLSGTPVAAGTYFVRTTAGNQSVVRRAVLVR